MGPSRLLSLKHTYMEPPKKSPVSVIGRLATSKWCGDAPFFLYFFFFLPTWKYVIHVHCIHGDQISHIQSIVATPM